jgi:hypothetical protein
VVARGPLLAGTAIGLALGIVLAIPSHWPGELLVEVVMIVAVVLALIPVVRDRTTVGWAGALESTFAVGALGWVITGLAIDFEIAAEDASFILPNAWAFRVGVASLASLGVLALVRVVIAGRPSI